MTAEATLHNFYSSFKLKAYEENSVPTGDEKPSMPYLTYNVSTDGFGSEVLLHIELWYQSTSWVEINKKAREIQTAIGEAGKILRCDGGVIWLKMGSPFAQSMGDESENTIKRKYINITAEFLTAN